MNVFLLLVFVLCAPFLAIIPLVVRNTEQTLATESPRRGMLYNK